MRFVDEYRAPEQVLQLVEHLQQRARLLDYSEARPAADDGGLRRPYPRHLQIRPRPAITEQY